MEAKAVKEALGALVGRIDIGQHCGQLQRVECQIDHGRKGFRHQSLPPVATGEQAPDLGC